MVWQMDSAIQAGMKAVCLSKRLFAKQAQASVSEHTRLATHICNNVKSLIT